MRILSWSFFFLFVTRQKVNQRISHYAGFIYTLKSTMLWAGLSFIFNRLYIGLLKSSQLFSHLRNRWQLQPRDLCINPSCATITFTPKSRVCGVGGCVALIHMVSCLSYFLTRLLQCSEQRTVLEDYLETSGSLEHGGTRSYGHGMLCPCNSVTWSGYQ